MKRNVAIAALTALCTLSFYSAAAAKPAAKAKPAATPAATKVASSQRIIVQAPGSIVVQPRVAQPRVVQPRTDRGPDAIVILAPDPVVFQAREPAAVPGNTEVGRYNMVQGKDNLYFIDTKTGRIWFRNVVQQPDDKVLSEWREATSPVTQSK